MDIENPLEKCVVLYVENNAQIRDNTIKFLASRVKRLWVAKSVRTALNIYEKHKPNIILSNFDMPKLDSVKMAKIIREEDKETPIILMISYSDQCHLFSAIEAQITDFIPKPFHVNILFKKLQKNAEEISCSLSKKKIQSITAQHQTAIEDYALLIYLDHCGRIKHLNAPMASLLDYPMDALLGEPMEDIIYKDSDFGNYLPLLEAFEKGSSWQGNLKLLSYRDKEFTFKATLIPFYEIDTPSFQFMFLLEDITELINYRNLLENKLNDTQRTLQEKIYFLKQYQNAINEGTAICRFTQEGRILKSDKRFDEIFRFEKNELVARHFYQLCPNIQKGLKEKVDQAVEKRVVLRERIRCRDKKGEFHITDSVFIPIYTASKKVEEIISIHNDITDIIKLNEEIKITQKELLYILGGVAENRSQETGSHVRRVAEYSNLLGKLAGLKKDETELLSIVTPMHDIGKIAIPDAILLKPGKLTDSESEIMKMHAQLGGDLFLHSDRPFMKAAHIVAMQHHENYDGSGYPRGLRGKDIHIFGRIVAIADVFDALSMKRVYKEGWKIEDIIKFMENEKGKKFDPILIELFLKNIDLFLDIKERYQDKLSEKI